LPVLLTPSLQSRRLIDIGNINKSYGTIEGEPACTIAVATSKQAEVIAFDTGELDCVVQRIAAVGTRGKLFVVHDLLRSISLRGKVTALPDLPLAQNAVADVGHDHTHDPGVLRIEIANIKSKALIPS
jgi:hypothetical protein